ncbi:Uncharacterized protein Fot_32603 [Forsythia ovata]|uniref:Uncharacterized protein n=1 Tax=Forsythia ovata TaxID=205694 RepID=A0ABD1T8A6_9LAMI
MEGMVEMSLHISMQIGYKQTARQEFFDVNPRRYSKADYKLIIDGIEDTAARRFRQYKANVNAYIRDKGTVVPYHGLTVDVWEKCIKRSSNKKFKTMTDQLTFDLAPRAYLLVAKGRADRAQRGGVQSSNPEILDLCLVASGSYHMVNSLGLSISSPPWLLGGTSCDLPPPPRA